MRIGNDDFEIFTSFEEFASRPLYREEIPVTEVDLARLVGPYRVKDEINCGLSNCHTRHKSGWIVETSDKYEGHIGHVCAERKFGVKFKDSEKKFKSWHTKKITIESIVSYLSQVESMAHSIESLSSSNLDFHIKQFARFKAIIPIEIRSDLDKRASANNSNIYEIVKLDDHEYEIEVMLAKEQKKNFSDEELGDLRYKSKLRGRLVGINAFDADWEKIRVGFPNIRQQAEYIDVDKLKEFDLQELRNMRKLFEDTNDNIARCELFLEECNKFFTPSNFSLIPYLASNERLKNTLKRELEWDFEKGMSKKETETIEMNLAEGKN